MRHGCSTVDLHVHTTAWGPAFQPLSMYRYARKVPEIRERDAERKAREAERGDGCAASCPVGCVTIEPPKS